MTIIALGIVGAAKPLRSNEAIAEPRKAREATEKVPITAFLFIFSVTLFKNYRKRTLKILRSEVFQWPQSPTDAKRRERPTYISPLSIIKSLCYTFAKISAMKAESNTSKAKHFFPKSLSEAPI